MKNISNYRVRTLIQDIKRRWRRRALIQGAAVSLLMFIGVGTLLLILHSIADVQPEVLVVSAIVGGIILLVVVSWWFLRPAFRKMSDRQIALFVEEKIPDLEDRLNSAVEINEGRSRRQDHSILIDKLIDDVSLRTRIIPLASIVDRKKERILAYSSLTLLVLFSFFTYRSIGTSGLTFSEFDLNTLVSRTDPLMTISPGNVEIEKGESQEILVTLREDTDREIILQFRSGDGEWQTEEMKKGLSAPVFLHEFLNIQEPIQYFVEYNQYQSESFLLSIYEFPEVDRIDLQYAYPSYTGLPPYTEENSGDIRGLQGSTVTLTVRTTGSVVDADLVVSDSTIVSLSSVGDGRFQGQIFLEEQGHYYVRLTDVLDKTNKFPEEYQISAIEDEQPFISITDPQRDVRVNSIEEVLIAATVDDDYGIRDVRLKYSVNGEDEQSIALMDQAGQRPKEVDGEHLFFLEDYQLAPGDVISYYIEAEDFYHVDRPEATDMYFIEVIPFDQQFTQQNNMGNTPGSQSSGVVLNQQQIIAATWKLHRERDEMEDQDFEESLDALILAQDNLKQNIEGRINSTAFSLELQMNEENRQVVEYLREAISEMDDAIVELRKEALQDALAPERRALNRLLKADALNKERQVAMNRQPGQGGMSATEERMTELMDLELDISKDKYEVQQQSPQARQEQEVDDALQRIRELARKQQNLANQGRSEELQGEDKKRRIEQLKREQDQLRQQTESLANSLRRMSRDNDQISRGMDEQLERVAENMREAEQALRDEDVQRAMARQQQAINELDRLQQSLRVASTDNTREVLENLVDDFQQIRDQERELGSDIRQEQERAQLRSGIPDEEALERLLANRRAMLDNLSRFETQTDAIQERTQQSDPDIASAARNVQQSMRREDLERDMRASEAALEMGWLDYARRLEEEIETGLDRLETEIRDLGSGLPMTEEEQLARSLEDVRRLMQQLEDMQEQMTEQAQAGNQEGQNQGRDQEGRTGQQPGRQARADAARAQRQMEQAQAALDRLQRDMRGNAATQRPLQSVQNALASSADFTGVRLEGESARAFFDRSINTPLSQLEMELLRRLDQIAIEKKLYGAREGEVPPEYRELVDKYYESLSRSRN